MPQLVTEPSFLSRPLISCWHHFLVFLGRWTQIFIQALAGRKGFNVLGAFIPQTWTCIEGFWKFLNKKWLYSKYDSEFSTFKNAITDCLSPTCASYKLELDFNFAPVFRPLKKRAPYSRYYGVKYKLETKLMASVGWCTDRQEDYLPTSPGRTAST